MTAILEDFQKFSVECHGINNTILYNFKNNLYFFYGKRFLEIFFLLSNISSVKKSSFYKLSL